jgi:hypothetical protein
MSVEERRAWVARRDVSNVRERDRKRYGASAARRAYQAERQRRYRARLKRERES